MNSALGRNSIADLAALADPTRHRVYAAVAAADEPLGRDAVAGAAELPLSTAALHLERLVEAGLLRVEHKRLSGRSGPGAGRPAKLYTATSAELIASIPERHYELAADLLASAAENADRDGIPVRDALGREARTVGAVIGAAAGTVDSALTMCGYAPIADGSGGTVLANCPFHALATRHTALVCGANLELVRGIVRGAGDDREPELVTPGASGAGACCVALRASKEA